MTKVKTLSFFELTIMQLGVFATAVFAFLLSMAWNNVVQAYSEQGEDKNMSLVIYAVVITVVSVLIMTSFSYFVSKYTNLQPTTLR